MSCFIFNDYDNYVSDIFDTNKKIKEDKKKLLISNIFKDTFKLVQIFIKKLIKIYYNCNLKFADLNKIFNFDEEELKIIVRQHKYKIDVKKKNKTEYKKYLNIIMKFIDNWENFILVMIKDINENNENYKDEKKYFEYFLEEECNWKIRGKLHGDSNLYKQIFINYVIYETIFNPFEWFFCSETVFEYQEETKKYKDIIFYPLKNINIFLTNINSLFRFDILPNTDKRLKILLSYFSSKINKKYEYSIDIKKFFKDIHYFVNDSKGTFNISNLDYLNDFEDTIFIFYEFLNLCFVLLEDNIDF